MTTRDAHTHPLFVNFDSPIDRWQPKHTSPIESHTTHAAGLQGAIKDLTSMTNGFALLEADRKRLKRQVRIYKGLLLGLLMVILVIVLTACTGSTQLPEYSSPTGGAPVPPALVNTPAPSVGVDAWEQYKAEQDRHPDWLPLNAQDAMTRAILGCEYPDEMINANPQDKALRDAYSSVCSVPVVAKPVN